MNWLIWKDPDAGKDWRQEEKGTTDNEIVEWHHWLDGHEFEQAPGAGEVQGSLARCSPWGHKEPDRTEQLNWTGQDSKEIKPVNPKGNQLWIFIGWLFIHHSFSLSNQKRVSLWCQSWISNTLVTWCEEPTHWKRPWCWERLKAGGDVGGRR